VDLSYALFRRATGGGVRHRRPALTEWPEPLAERPEPGRSAACRQRWFPDVDADRGPRRSPTPARSAGGAKSVVTSLS